MSGISKEARKSLAEKLSKLAEDELSDEERKGLEAVMRTAAMASAGENPAAREPMTMVFGAGGGPSSLGGMDLLAEGGDNMDDLLEDIKDIRNMPEHQLAATVTTVTVITVLASHPKIGC